MRASKDQSYNKHHLSLDMSAIRHKRNAANRSCGAFLEFYPNMTQTVVIVASKQ